MGVAPATKPAHRPHSEPVPLLTARPKRPAPITAKAFGWLREIPLAIATSWVIERRRGRRILENSARFPGDCEGSKANRKTCRGEASAIGLVCGAQVGLISVTPLGNFTRASSVGNRRANHNAVFAVLPVHRRGHLVVGR